MADDRRDDPRPAPAPHRQIQGDFHDRQPDRSHGFVTTENEKLLVKSPELSDMVAHLGLRKRCNGWDRIASGSVVLVATRLLKVFAPPTCQLQLWIKST